jgi:hypothetical protein
MPPLFQTDKQFITITAKEPMNMPKQQTRTLTALSLVAALAVSAAFPASAQTASSTPLAAEQIAARRAAMQAQIEASLKELEDAMAQAMAEAQAAAALRPQRTAAQTLTQQDAQQALYQTNLAAVEDWLHAPIKMPDGTPAPSLQDLTDAQAMIASANADAIIAQQQAALDDAIAWGATNGWPAVIGGDDAPRGYLVSRDENGPQYLMPFGLAEAITVSTTNVWPGGPTGFNLTGTNVTISMWDEASPRLTHIELSPRATELDGNTTNSYHSTAVAGILAGVGVNLYSGTNLLGPLAKGMAYAAQVQARDMRIDLGEMTAAIGTNHMRLSNQSYGWIGGWYFDGATWYWYGYPTVSGTQDPAFGNYTTNAATFDNLIQGAPTYLQVWAAGNDQGEAPPVQPTNHVERTGFTTAYRPPDGDQGGYDTISEQGCAKNVLTVGAIYPLANGYAGPTNVLLASFSSCGPTDDGRIKPDVVADGINDITPGASSDGEYVQWPGGTSFAAPGVAGSVGLLSQFYKQLHPNGGEPLASTLKGLVIHTADSCTTNAGPSYRFGWGVMNTRSAATLIGQDATNGLKNQIKEVLLTNNSTIQFPVVAADGTNPLKVTICWNDPAGTPNDHTNLDNPIPKLVNDLDLRVVSPTGSTNLPWVLNPDLTNQTSAARSAVATTGDDSRNNVEQVYIAHPTNATYVVRVTHKGNLQSNGTQWASILVSGNVPQAAPPLLINQMLKTATNTLAIGWPAVAGAQYQLQSRSAIVGGNWSNVDGIISARLTNVVTLVPFSPTNATQFFRVAQLP